MFFFAELREETPSAAIIIAVVQSLSSVHFGGVARALARRGRISLESETGTL